jgi:cytoskeletal protein CcmA (bactofilin family)
MFRRKKDEPVDMKTPAAPPQAPAPASPSEPEAEAIPARPFPRPAPPSPAGSLARAPAPPMGRTGVPARAAEPVEGRKLIVGKEIVLSGQITSCERLVVEGRVEASLSDSRWMEIAESGVFKGMAEIENAEIAGTFEGTLTVREKLMVRAGGKVSGTIRYARIEIEEGGQIAGEVSVDMSRAAKAETSTFGNDGG